MARRGGIFGAPSAGQSPAGVTPTGAKGRGPGNNRGGNPGGNKKTKLPGGGLYGGKAGEAQSNTDPMAYFTSMLGNSGLLAQTNTPQDIWIRDQAVKNLFDNYTAWNARTQRDSPEDFMRANYGGAGYSGKKGQNFSAGTLGSLTEGLPAKYKHVYANENQEAFLNEQGAQRLGAGTASGTPNFDTWYSTVFQPQTQTRFRAAQRDAPGLNFDDWLANYDMLGQAQRGYANRPDVMRGQSVAPEIGHWSWWA